MIQQEEIVFTVCTLPQLLVWWLSGPSYARRCSSCGEVLAADRRLPQSLRQPFPASQSPPPLSSRSLFLLPVYHWVTSSRCLHLPRRRFAWPRLKQKRKVGLTSVQCKPFLQIYSWSFLNPYDTCKMIWAIEKLLSHLSVIDEDVHMKLLIVFFYDLKEHEPAISQRGFVIHVLA